MLWVLLEVLELHPHCDEVARDRVIIEYVYFGQTLDKNVAIEAGRLVLESFRPMGCKRRSQEGVQVTPRSFQPNE